MTFPNDLYFSGDCNGYAYTENAAKCPDETGNTWKYYVKEEEGSWFGPWADAGRGLEVKCTNMTGNMEGKLRLSLGVLVTSVVSKICHMLTSIFSQITQL